ncbi:MAG: glycogen synthase GlgA [Thermoanaerobaculia bacterium]
MKILFASAEVSPIAKTGGLGDVCGSLPKALAKLGHEVAVFMPYYRQARDWFASHEVPLEQVVPATAIRWGNWVAESTVWRTLLPESDVPLYLIANDHFFDRAQIYSLRADGVDDGAERFTFFCRAVIHAAEAIGFSPDIVHAHDWHTALLPVYLQSGLRGSQTFRSARSVFTIHNLNYQGIAPVAAFPALGLPSRYFAPDALEHFGDINLMKGGILFADQVTTVSPTYAREIQTREHGAGLDGLLRSLSFRLHGVLNGIDTEEWDPASDPLIPAHFEAGRLNGKVLSKRALLREAGLRYQAKTPLLSFVSRLVDQKGIDLLLPVLDRLLGGGAQAVILGSGESRYERALLEVASRNPAACKVWIGFDNALAHRIYAGSDILLVPSLYEPCGLNQMYALRYGTLPVVRMTGGLADTVLPFDGTNRQEANGFGFRLPVAEQLHSATWISMLNYRDPQLWKELQSHAMAADFSWNRSANEYERIYRGAHWS